MYKFFTALMFRIKGYFVTKGIDFFIWIDTSFENLYEKVSMFCTEKIEYLHNFDILTDEEEVTFARLTKQNGLNEKEAYEIIADLRLNGEISPENIKKIAQSYAESH